MRLQKSTLIFLVFLSLVPGLSGCWSLNPLIHPTRLIDNGTKIEIIDVTKDGSYYSAGTHDQKSRETMMQRIIALTRDELVALNIEPYTEPVRGSAKIKYEIRTVTTAGRCTGSFFSFTRDPTLEVGYQVLFENPEGKTIFKDIDSECGSDSEEVVKSIAQRTARNVSNSFKDKQ